MGQGRVPCGRLETRGPFALRDWGLGLWLCLRWWVGRSSRAELSAGVVVGFKGWDGVRGAGFKTCDDETEILF